MIKSYLKRKDGHFSDPSIFENFDDVFEVISHFRKLSKLGFHTMPIEELWALYNTLVEFFPHIISATRIVDNRISSLYRASVVKNITGDNRKLLTLVTQLTAPPAELVKIGRCNTGADPIFYSSLHFDTAIMEVLQDVGDFIIVSEWKIKQEQSLNCHMVCHPEITLMNDVWRREVDHFLGAMEEFPKECTKIIIEILKFFAEEFTKPVERENYWDYLVSATISNQLLNSKPTDGGKALEAIIYPGAKDPAGPMNFAIRNTIVHEKLDLKALHLVHINEIGYAPLNPEKSISVGYTRYDDILDSFDIVLNSLTYKNFSIQLGKK